MSLSLNVVFRRAPAYVQAARIAGVDVPSRGTLTVTPEAPEWSGFARLTTPGQSALDLSDGAYVPSAEFVDDPGEGAWEWREPRVVRGQYTATHAVIAATEWEREPTLAELLAEAERRAGLVAAGESVARAAVEAALPRWRAWTAAKAAAEKAAAAARKVAEEKAAAEKAAAKARALDEALAWAQEHGSARLRAIVAEGLLEGSLAVYRDERLAAERPGWVWYADEYVRGSVVDPRNPPAEAFDLLAAARAAGAPEAKLQRLMLDGRPGPWCAHDLFLGRGIVYLGSQEDVYEDEDDGDE